MKLSIDSSLPLIFANFFSFLTLNKEEKKIVKRPFKISVSASGLFLLSQTVALLAKSLIVVPSVKSFVVGC